MDLQTELLREHSAANNQRLMQYVGAVPARVIALVSLVCGPPGRPAQLAADVLGWVGEAQPAALLPHWPRLLAAMRHPQHHPAVRRGILRALQFAPLPEELLAETFDHCLHFLGGAEPIAVQVYALDVAARIARQHPTLAAELLVVLEPRLPTASAALRSRSGRWRAELRRLAAEVS